MTTVPDDHRRALPPPRFGMKTLLAGVAILCGTLAIATAVGAQGSIGVLLIFLTALAHLAGAHFGRQLRDHGSRPLSLADHASSPRKVPPKSDFAPATNLSERRTLGWPLLIGVAGGAAAGALLGCAWILTAFQKRASFDMLAVGGMAFGLLGAFAAFLSIGFCQVALRALHDAQKTS